MRYLLAHLPRIVILVMAFALSTSTAAQAAGRWHLGSPYKFEVLNAPIVEGENREVDFRLIDTATGKPIDGLALTNASLKMDFGLIGGSQKIAMLEPKADGDYVLRTDFPSAGFWDLGFFYQPPGADGPIHGTLLFAVKKSNEPGAR